MLESNTSTTIEMSPGCAAQVPSWPAFTSRSLSALTSADAASFAAGLFLMGICAACQSQSQTGFVPLSEEAISATSALSKELHLISTKLILNVKPLIVLGVYIQHLIKTERGREVTYHSTHGMNTTSVTSLNQQLCVALQKMLFHTHLHEDHSDKA